MVFPATEEIIKSYFSAKHITVTNYDKPGYREAAKKRLGYVGRYRAGFVKMLIFFKI